MMAHVAWRLSRRAAVNLWRAPLPSLVSVLTISLALFIGASFVLALLAARALLTSWGAQAAVTLYLDRQTTDDQARALSKQVRAMVPADMDVRTSIASRLKRLRTDLGDLAGALDGLSQNPLPPSLELTPRVTLPRRRARAGRAAGAPAGRDRGRVRPRVARQARGAGPRPARLRRRRAFTVLGAALLVVANTIRLAVYARRDEIEIMKLVGATDGYVRAPFLLEGALQGLIGAGSRSARSSRSQQWLLPRRASLCFCCRNSRAQPDAAYGAALLGIGRVVGLFGSWLAVARFLRT